MANVSGGAGGGSESASTFHKSTAQKEASMRFTFFPLVLWLFVCVSDLRAQAIHTQEPLGYSGVLGLFYTNIVNDHRLASENRRGPGKKWTRQALLMYWPPLLFQDIYDRYDPLFAGLSGMSVDQRLIRYDQLIDQMNAEVFKRLERLFDSSQLERLRQFDRRAQGPRAFQNMELLNRLGLTDEQRTKLSAFSASNRQKIAEILKKGGSGDSSREETERQVATVQRQSLDEMISLLTERQKETWRELLGPPLETGLTRAGIDAGDDGRVRTLKGHSWLAYSVAFSPDGKMLVSGSWDKTAILWDAVTGKEIRTFRGHTQRIRGVAFSPDGKWVATGSWDNTVKLWDITTGKVVRTLSHPMVNSVAFSPDGKLLASASTSSDGRLSFDETSKDPTIKLWDVHTGKEVRTLRGHTFYVYSVRFSPDGKLLASGSRDGTVRLWDVATGQEVRTLKTGKGWALSVAFSPDGKMLAAGTRDKTIVLWDVATGRQIRTLTGGHTDWVYGVAFQSGGEFLASGSKDTTIKLWHLATGREVNAFKRHMAGVRSVAISPDGKTLASASWDYTVKLWDISQSEGGK